ncbi:MAG: hypothetical protein Q4E75_06575 [bacterium]|nr:hypothetical protein [bacterium]
MIKKINLLIILVSLFGSLYFVFTKDNSFVLVLKDLSLVFTINLLYIISFIFKFKINDNIHFIYILFIFLAQFIGVTCEMYNYISWYDTFTHFLSGILTGVLALIVLNKLKINKNILFNILFIITFSVFIAVLWEMFEYVSSILFNVDPQKVLTTGVNDTMKDIIVAFLGSILVSMYYFFKRNS